MIDRPSAACRVCQAWGTPQCVECPTNVARWRRAFCRAAWRWRLSLLWSSLITVAAVGLAVAR